MGGILAIWASKWSLSGALFLVIQGGQYYPSMDTDVSRKTYARWAIAASAVILAWWLWVTSRLALTPDDGLVCPDVLPSPVGCASSDRMMFAAITAAIMLGVFALGMWRLSRRTTRPWVAWSATGTFAIAALAVYRVVLFQ